MRNPLVRGLATQRATTPVQTGIGKQVLESAASDDALLRDAARCELLRRLAHTLRHDLNSPIQAALWAFDLMQKGVESHPDENQRTKLLTSLHLGRNEIARLQAAARVFLSCAAPMDEPMAAFDLREVIGEIDRLTAAEASLHDVHVTFQVPADSLLVNGARAHLQLALLQLTLDALDQAGQGGSVAVNLTSADANATVNFNAASKAAAALPAKSGASTSLNGARVTERIATSHKGHVRRRQSAANMEVEFAIPRA